MLQKLLDFISGSSPEKRKEKRINAGYLYAKEQLTNGESVAHLENLVDTAKMMGDKDEFDDGILKAISEYKQTNQYQDQALVGFAC